MPKTLHVELELVVHLWVDYDPGAEPSGSGPASAWDAGEPAQASIIGGQLRGVPLGVEALAAIAAAYEPDILAEARLEAAHREHPSLPLDAS